VKTRFEFKSVTLVIGTVIFCIVFAAGLALRVRGPIKIGSDLSVTSEGGHWLAFFESPERGPLFNMMFGIGIEDGVVVLAKNPQAHLRRETGWFLGDACYVRQRFVDDAGRTHLLQTDFRLPGIFYMNYRSSNFRVLTFAMRWWLVLGLPALLPGLWVVGWIRGRLRAPN
jgi:hypothetical protein